LACFEIAQNTSVHVLFWFDSLSPGIGIAFAYAILNRCPQKILGAQPMIDCKQFRLPPSGLTIVAIAILLIVAPKLAQAQPVKKARPNLVQLQQQLAALQSQISSMSPVDDDSNSSSRVKSVGSQRAKRAIDSYVDDPMHIRLYDLSDLFAVSPHYPAVLPNDLAMPTSMFRSGQGQMVGGIGQGGGFGGGGAGGGSMSGSGGGGVFSIPSTPPNPAAPPRQEAASISLRSAQVSMDQLVTTMKETVEPDMWGTNRDDAKVQFLGNTLLITATENMHVQINNLLNLFREHWGRRRTISIQTFWIRAGAAEAAVLLDAESNDTIGAGVVNAEKWKQFLDTAKSEKRFKYSATMTGHNNQTLHALSGRQRQLTLDAIPFETTKASMWFDYADEVSPYGDESEDDEDMNWFNRTRNVVGFKPVRQSFHDGAAIQVTPLATRGGNFVILDLHAKVNELIKPSPDSRKPTVFVDLGEKQRAEVELDHADYISYRLNTTLRCPKDQVVLAGGMTYDPNAEDEHPNLYLFVKTSVHTITEDKSDWSKEDELPKE
jgi:hypothetical protein